MRVCSCLANLTEGSSEAAASLVGQGAVQALTLFLSSLTFDVVEALAGMGEKREREGADV